MNPKSGDKVRVKANDYRGERGVIKAVEGERLAVVLDHSGLVIRVDVKEVTNLSLAARKAWVTGPDRPVGRRKGTRLCDRVSVTLRIDRSLWELFLDKQKKGVIEDRTELVNDWFREKLAALDGRKARR